MLLAIFDEFSQFSYSDVWLLRRKLFSKLLLKVLSWDVQFSFQNNIFHYLQELWMTVDKVGEISNDDRVEVSVTFLTFVYVIGIFKLVLRISFFAISCLEFVLAWMGLDLNKFILLLFFNLYTVIFAFIDMSMFWIEIACNLSRII